MAEIVSEAMEMLHDQSIPTIELLQKSFPDNKQFMINISTLLDPKYVFLIYAPILFAINKRVGHRMLIALTLTEWANQVLKWLLAGERPYWYVHERANELAAANNQTQQLMAESTGIESYDMATILADYNKQQPLIPQLRQFPVTCELGAGSPSGHAMVTATVWYVLIDAYLKGELPIFNRVDYTKIESFVQSKLSKLSWSIYTLILLMVSLSRVYLACHFPHQCLCGAILGILVARLVIEKLPMEMLQRKHFVATTMLMFASAMATYTVLRSLGVNPLWSVDKGMRWCVKKEYIHLDTTPFFSMMRYLGFCLGAGLAFDSSKIARESLGAGSEKTLPADARGNGLFIRRSLVALASISFGQMLLSLPLPRENLQVFYLISFVIYTIFSFAIAAPIPRLVKQSFPGSGKNQIKNS